MLQQLKYRICKDCEFLAYPLGNNELEGIYFCTKKVSRITINDICNTVPHGRYYNVFRRKEE